MFNCFYICRCWKHSGAGPDTGHIGSDITIPVAQCSRAVETDWRS